MYVGGSRRCNVRNDLRRQGVFESPGETGRVLQPTDGPYASLSGRSIAISVASVVIALASVCSPIDLVPEALVPLVGFVDDLLVLVGGMVLARAFLVAALSARDRRRQELRGYEETEPFVGKWSP